MTDVRACEIIEAAVRSGFVSKMQAAVLKEELSMFPGGNILSILMRRGMISPEQAKALENPASAIATPDSIDDPDMDDSASGVTPVREGSPFAATFSVPAAQSPLAAPAAFKSRDSVSEQPLTSAPKSKLSLALAEAQKALYTPVTKSSSLEFCPDPLMVKMLKRGREMQCSDLHITVGKPPYLRQEGKLHFLDEDVVSPPVAQRLVNSVLTSAQRVEFEHLKQLDFSFECAGSGRFRANVYLQRMGVEGSFRFIPQVVPTLESLQLPAVLEKLTSYPQGLNLVTGPGGCGKTSTVAAMLEYINCHRHDHIITVEDPVEIVFKPKKCQITQREVGTHTTSFATALRTALRQDPDVILIGELRDLETTSISITAAETGHLVFSTLHTSSAVRTVARILDVYPPSQRPQICMMVAESLRGVVSQQLVPRQDGRGRVCAMEILLVTTGVAQMIKEGKTHQLVSHMQSGRKLGMVSMDDALTELFQSGVITGNVAWSHAENKSMFDSFRTQS